MIGRESMENDFYSCPDLQQSVYLAPSKVRTCCQRFFVDGKQEGDVVLLDVTKGDQVTAETILGSKLRLIKEINSGEMTACSGCPYLQKKDWETLNKENFQVRHLSLEYHSVCNLKCTYCSDEYYGGKSAQYDIYELISQLKKLGYMEFCDSIVWGGGEPVLDSNFENLLNLILNDLSPEYLRFFTNSVRHSSLIQKLLNEGKIYITTSIDAGSAETYKKIRGFDRLEKVYANLSKYAENSPERVTIKYIFTEGNTSTKEVRAFLDYISRYRLSGVNFQISFDFTKEKVEKNDYLRIIEMFSGLQDLKARSIFLDDLIWQRFSSQDFASIVSESEFSELGFDKLIASKTPTEKIVVWGTGSMANFLVKKSKFFSDAPPEYFVDGEKELQAESQFEENTGKKIYPPTKLLEDDSRIVIAAAQQLPVILKSMADLGINPKRVVREIVL
jgi:pyruvate-formate lyase-activating enzyme